MSDRDLEDEYRREKFGTPGPVDAWLAARLAHGVGDRDDKTDTLEGEYGRADEERETVRVEVLDFRDATLSDETEFRAEYVDQACEDERVRYERRRAEFGEVANKCKREKNDQLNEDEVCNGD